MENGAGGRVCRVSAGRKEERTWSSGKDNFCVANNLLIILFPALSPRLRLFSSRVDYLSEYHSQRMASNPPRISTSSPGVQTMIIRTPFTSLAACSKLNLLDEKTDPKPESKTLARERFIEGYEVVCCNCGTLSRDLHFCDYCRFKLSPDAKLIAICPKAETSNDESVAANSPAKRRSEKGKGSVECIILSSDDEDKPKPKVSKTEIKLDASSVSTNSTSAVVKKELQID